MSMDWNKILEEQEKDPGYKPVPADKYHIRVVKADATKTAKGDDMLKIVVQIVGGPYDTKQVYTNLTFIVSNPKAMRFTLRKLKALGISDEILAAQNPTTAQIGAMILGAEAIAEVIEKPATDEYEASNDVKSLRSLTSAAGGAPPPPPIPSPAPNVGDIPTPTIPTPPPEAAPPAPPEPEAASVPEAAPEAAPAPAPEPPAAPAADAPTEPF